MTARAGSSIRPTGGPSTPVFVGSPGADRAVIVALALAATVAWAAPRGPAPPTESVFHAVLERSAPAAGETLGAAPRELLLVFSGPIEELGASVRVLGPGGAAWTIEVRHPEGDARALGGPF